MVFADDQVKMKSLGWALIEYDCVLTKRGNLDPVIGTEARRHEDSGRTLSASQRMLTATANYGVGGCMEQNLLHSPQKEPFMPTP